MLLLHQQPSFYSVSVISLLLQLSRKGTIYPVITHSVRAVTCHSPLHSLHGLPFVFCQQMLPFCELKFMLITVMCSSIHLQPLFHIFYLFHLQWSQNFASNLVQSYGTKMGLTLQKACLQELKHWCKRKTQSSKVKIICFQITCNSNLHYFKDWSFSSLLAFH
jgi:hypothetical protein